MSDLDNLLTLILDGTRTPFAPEFERWLRDSRRFRAFASSHHTKIRSKLKNARDDSTLQDVRAELSTAALLLRENRFTLEYEKYAALKQRGPDFTVTFKTHTPFNVEVRRIRGAELDGGTTEIRLGKLMTVVCDKSGQMPPGIVNLLWLASETDIPIDHLTRAVATLRQLAERKDEPFFSRHNYASAAAFIRQFQHLSVIIVRHPAAIEIWQNTLARHKCPPDIAAAIRRLPLD